MICLSCFTVMFPVIFLFYISCCCLISLYLFMMHQSEYEAWCSHFEGSLPRMNDDEQCKMEYLTGKIPLYLEAFLQRSAFRGTFTFEDAYRRMYRSQVVRNVPVHLSSLTSKILKSKDDTDLSSHRSILRAAFLELPSFVPNHTLYAHRYIYLEFCQDPAKVQEYAHCVSGVVREQVAHLLLDLQKDVFLGIEWIDLYLSRETVKPVKGFLAERVIISAVASRGLQLDSVHWIPPKVSFSIDALISVDVDVCALFVPIPFNFEAIDLLMRSTTAAEVKEVQKKITIIACQVTLQTPKRHRTLIGTFF
eukprot:Rmarinus@m.22583